jgi:hypothetical protein
MADCDLCGVSRPTLCPVKVDDPRFRSAFPKGMWMGLCEECTSASNDAKRLHAKADGKNKCDLCGMKGVDLYVTEIRVPDFSEPYYKEKEKALCEPCLQAAEDAYNKRQAEIAAHKGHH